LPGEELGHLPRLHAAFQCPDCYPEFDQVLIAIAHAVATAAAEFRLAEGNAQQPQVTDLVDQPLRGRRAAPERPEQLAMGKI
jgi:hypothetical protein